MRYDAPPWVCHASFFCSTEVSKLKAVKAGELFTPGLPHLDSQRFPGRLEGVNSYALTAPRSFFRFIYLAAQSFHACGTPADLLLQSLDLFFGVCFFDTGFNGLDLFDHDLVSGVHVIN